MITNVIRANVVGGRLDLQVPPDWPDGVEVEVRPLSESSMAGDAPMTSDEIARTLAAMDAVQSFELSDEERATIDAARQARKAWEIANFDQRAGQVGRGWE